MVYTRYSLKEKYRNWNLFQGKNILGKPLNDFVGNMKLEIRTPTTGHDVDLPDLKASVDEHMISRLAAFEGKITGGSTPPSHMSERANKPKYVKPILRPKPR